MQEHATFSDVIQTIKQQYEDALKRIEELFPLVTDDTLDDDKNAVVLLIGNFADRQ